MRSDAGNWVERYFSLKRDPCCRVFFEHERLGRPADSHDRPRLHDRSNRWRLNSARAEVDADDLYVLTLYDSTQQAGGTDGTRGFAELARRHASHYENINLGDIRE